MIDGALPAAGLALRVALHRYLRWRLPGLRPGPTPRRGALPVPARHVRARHAGVDGVPCGVFAWHRRPRSTVELSRAAGSGDGVTADAGLAAPTPRRTRDDARVARRPPVCWPRSTQPACSTPPTCTSRPRIGRLGGEAGDDVLLAVALAVRAIRLGSVCVDLAAVRARSSAPATSRSTSRRCHGRNRSPGLRPARRARWSPSGRRRPAGARSARRRPALPRAVLAPGGARPHRARRPHRRTARRCRPGAAAEPGWTGCSEPRATLGKTAAPRRGRRRPSTRHRARWRARHRQDHHRGSDPRPPARPARTAAADRTGRADRARPPPGCRRRSAPQGPAILLRPPCTGCSAGGRAPAASATTATTACPTTWWWSTRRRWCR